MENKQKHLKKNSKSTVAKPAKSPAKKPAKKPAKSPAKNPTKSLNRKKTHVGGGDDDFYTLKKYCLTFDDCPPEKELYNAFYCLRFLAYTYFSNETMEDKRGAINTIIGDWFDKTILGKDEWDKIKEYGDIMAFYTKEEYDNSFKSILSQIVNISASEGSEKQKAITELQQIKYPYKTLEDSFKLSPPGEEKHTTLASNEELATDDTSSFSSSSSPSTQKESFVPKSLVKIVSTAFRDKDLNVRYLECSKEITSPLLCVYKEYLNLQYCYTTYNCNIVAIPKKGDIVLFYYGLPATKNDIVGHIGGHVGLIADDDGLYNIYHAVPPSVLLKKNATTCKIRAMYRFNPPPGEREIPEDYINRLCENVVKYAALIQRKQLVTYNHFKQVIAATGTCFPVDYKTKNKYEYGSENANLIKLLLLERFNLKQKVEIQPGQISVVCSSFVLMLWQIALLFEDFNTKLIGLIGSNIASQLPIKHFTLDKLFLLFTTFLDPEEALKKYYEEQSKISDNALGNPSQPIEIRFAEYLKNNKDNLSELCLPIDNERCTPADTMQLVHNKKRTNNYLPFEFNWSSMQNFDLSNVIQFQQASTSAFSCWKRVW